MKKLVLGKATLILGDAYEIVPTLPAVDALVIDPQYKFSASGGGRFRKARRKHMDAIEAVGLNEGFDFNIIDPAKFRSVVVFCHNDQVPDLWLHLRLGYARIALCGWRKTNPVPMANKHYVADFEPYFHAWNKDGHPVGKIQERKRITDYKNGSSNYDHPTVKPDFIMDKIMKNVNGESVLDCFMGSGSTGIAALKAGKSFIGIEKNPAYFNIAASRICAYYTAGMLSS